MAYSKCDFFSFKTLVSSLDVSIWSLLNHYDAIYGFTLWETKFLLFWSKLYVVIIYFCLLMVEVIALLHCSAVGRS